MPQPNEMGLVIAHDDAGVRAADEGAAVILKKFRHLRTP
jgi:hypothetical protein